MRLVNCIDKLTLKHIDRYRLLPYADYNQLMNSFVLRIVFCNGSHKSTSTRQKIRIFWKIAITFLTLAQNPFNCSKRFSIILEINEGKLVHNYAILITSTCTFFKNAFFLRIFI